MKKDILNGGSTDQIPQYVKARAAFFDEAGRFLNGAAQGEILAEIDKQLAKKGITAEQRQNGEQIRAQVSDIFGKTQGVYKELSDIRSLLSKSLQGAFCIIGVSATSTTDLGVTPFASDLREHGPPCRRGEHDHPGPVPPGGSLVVRSHPGGARLRSPRPLPFSS